MSTITTDKKSLKKLDEISSKLKEQTLRGRRGFRSAAFRLAVDVLYQLIFAPEKPIDLEKMGFVQHNSHTLQYKQ